MFRRFRFGQEISPAQDESLHTVLNRGAETYGHHSAKAWRHGIGGHATDAVATAPYSFILLGLALTRVIVLVIVRTSLIGRDRLESNRNIDAAAQRQGE